MARYQELEKRISNLENELSRNQSRKFEAEQRVNEAKHAIGDLSEQLEKSLVRGDEKKAEKLKAEIGKLQDKTIHLDTMLILGLEKQSVDLDKQLARAKADQALIFSKLAERWLEKEIGVYDSQAKQVIPHIKRLVVCHRLLQDVGHQQVYQKALGEALSYLPAARVPVIGGFNKTNYLSSGTYHADKALVNAVFEEIVS